MGPPCFRAIVTKKTQVTKTDDGEDKVTVCVRYLGKKRDFNVSRKSKQMHYSELLQLVPGDEMYVSHDGEDICNIKHNPCYKRWWLATRSVLTKIFTGAALLR